MKDLIRSLQYDARFLMPNDELPDVEQLPEPVVDAINDHLRTVFPEGEAHSAHGVISTMALVNGARIACEALDALGDA